VPHEQFTRGLRTTTAGALEQCRTRWVFVNHTVPV
jgi:hypothetical protein